MVKTLVHKKNFHSSICLHKKNICKNKISGGFVRGLGMIFMWMKEKKIVGHSVGRYTTCGSSAHSTDDRVAQIWGFSFSAPTQLLSLAFGCPQELLPAGTIHKLVFSEYSQILHFWDLLLHCEVSVFSTSLASFLYLFFVHRYLIMHPVECIT